MDWLTERFGTLGAEALVLAALWVVARIAIHVLGRRVERKWALLAGVPVSEISVERVIAMRKTCSMRTRRAGFLSRIVMHVLKLGLAPTGEELMYRGAVLLLAAWQPHAEIAIILTCATAFSLSHFPRFNLVARTHEQMIPERFRTARTVFQCTIAFVFGIVSGYIALRTQSLFIVAALHALTNFLLPSALQCVRFVIRLGFDVVEYTLHPTATMREVRLRWEGYVRMRLRRQRSRRPDEEQVPPCCDRPP